MSNRSPGSSGPVASPFSSVNPAINTNQQKPSRVVHAAAAVEACWRTSDDRIRAQQMHNKIANTFQQAVTVGLQVADKSKHNTQPTPMMQPQQQQAPCWQCVSDLAPAGVQQAQMHWNIHSGTTAAEPSQGIRDTQDDQHSTPVLNTAAKAVLLRCLQGLDGVNPAARKTLQQLISSMQIMDKTPTPDAAGAAAAPAAAAMGRASAPEGHVVANDGGRTSSLANIAGAAAQQPAEQQQQQQHVSPLLTADGEAAAAPPSLPQLQVQPSVGEDAVTTTANGFLQMKLLPQQHMGTSAAAAAATNHTLPAAGPPMTQQLAGPLLSMQASGGRSAVTNRSRVLAAELGVVRPGPAGSSLRLAGTICRSNSGTLVDSLLSEAARADAGLLTAGLPRSDSLPEALLSGPLPLAGVGSGSSGPAAAAGGGVGVGGVGAKVLSDSVRECLRDVTGLTSLNIMDLDLPSLSLSGLPSLTFMLEQRSLMELKSLGPPPAAEAAAAAGTQAAQSQQHQQQHTQQVGAVSPADEQQQQADVVDDHFTMHPTPFLKHESYPAGDEDTAPLPAAAPPQATPSAAAAVAAHWVSNVLGTAPSCGAQGRVAAALLGHGPPQPPAAATLAAAEVAVSKVAAASAVALPDQLHIADPAAAVPGAQLMDVPHLMSPDNTYLHPADQPQQNILSQARQQHPPQQQFVPHFGGPLGPSTSVQIRQLQVELGMFGTALAAAPGGLGQQAMQQQDTLDGLLQQVNQELMAEAYTKQRAALQFGTVDVEAAGQQAAPTSAAAGGATGGAAMASPFTGISDGSMAGGQAGGVLWQQQGVGVFNLGHNWHMGPSSTAGGLAGGVAYGVAAAAPAFDPGVSRGLLLHGGRSKAAAVAAQQQPTVGQKQEVVRYSRVITCKTYLKRLNITQPMAEHLLPYHNVHTPTARTTSAAAAAAAGGDDTPVAGGKSGSSYELMFKEDVFVVDCHGARYKVVYEGVSCNQQKHLRLTSGWRDYIRGHAVQVGDTIVFERRGDDRHTLYVSVVKGDGTLTAEADEGEEAGGAGGGGPTKKRRVSRSQAVQRLE